MIKTLKLKIGNYYSRESGNLLRGLPALSIMLLLEIGTFHVPPYARALRIAATQRLDTRGINVVHTYRCVTAGQRDLADNIALNEATVAILDIQHGEQLGIAGTAQVVPSLVGVRERGNVLLGDNLLEFRLLISLL